MAPPILLLAAVAVLPAVALLRYFLVQPFRDNEKTRLWSKLDTLGVPPTRILPWPRALLGSLTRTQKTVREGYQRISIALDRPFALPTIWTWGAVVVLPPSLLDVLHRPGSQLRAFDAQLETIQLPYMISDSDVYNNVIHFDVVRKHMVNSKDVASLAPLVSDELDIAFRECWGDSADWKTLNSWDGCGRIITRAATRILIGLPMCRDPAFFEPARLFSDFVMAGTVMINCLPPFLRPIIGPLFALPAKHYEAQCLKVLVPYTRERVRLWRNRGEEENAPNDFLEWMIPKCAKEGPAQMDPVRLATRLLALNTMFIISMAYVFAHCVEDIYGSPSHEKFVQGLETECKRVHSQNDGLTTKEALDDLHRVDSALRESMRFSDIAITALPRDVISRNLDIGNGLQLPPGTRIVFPTQAIHRDPGNYENPLNFDAFRFSRKFEGGNEAEPGKSVRERESLTSITPSFLAFGYGKNSCPGRFFAAQTMKQSLAHLLLHYDVEICGELTKRQLLLNMMVPRKNVLLKIRRKG